MKLYRAKYKPEADIKNIIFDWGGVITDLHVNDTIEALRALGNDRFDSLLQHGPEEIFRPFEIGTISAEEFRKRIRKYLQPAVSDLQIDEAWSAMLGELPEERWKLLDGVRDTYHTFLLSNTNSVHLQYYVNFLQKRYNTNGFGHLFEKIYLSFELGMRKPDEDIFLQVLKQSHLKPEETFFIDDTEANTIAAAKLGIHTYLLGRDETLVDLFCFT